MRRQQGGKVWFGVWAVCGALWCAAAAGAQDPLPGPDAAAWLEEAGVQSRRVTGVGDTLTYALQAKAGLLAIIAHHQESLGEAAAAEQNRKVVQLCVRALSHEDDQGWVLLIQAQIALEAGDPDEARRLAEAIPRPMERGFAYSLLSQSTDDPELSAAFHQNWETLRDQVGSNLDQYDLSMPRDLDRPVGVSREFWGHGSSLTLYNTKRCDGFFLTLSESPGEAWKLHDELEPTFSAHLALGIAEALMGLEDPLGLELDSEYKKFITGQKRRSESEATPSENQADPPPQLADEPVNQTRSILSEAVIDGLHAATNTPQIPTLESAHVEASTQTAVEGQPDAAALADAGESDDRAADENSMAEIDVAELPDESIVDEVVAVESIAATAAVDSTEAATDHVVADIHKSPAIDELATAVVGADIATDADETVAAEPLDESVAASDEQVLEPEVVEASVEPAMADGAGDRVDAAAEASAPPPEIAADTAVAAAVVAETPTPAAIVPDLKVLADPAAVLDDTPAPETFDVTFVTTRGPFTVRVERGWAPGAADRFHDLVASGYYHNQRFFRVVPGFVVQWGIHGYPAVAAAWRTNTFADEPRTQANARGTVAFAAASTPDTRTTQVFINLDDNAYLDELGFAPFGRVTEGMDVVEQLFGGYGETPSEKQRDIQLRGNTFLDARFPELDSIVTVEIKPQGE